MIPTLASQPPAAALPMSPTNQLARTAKQSMEELFRSSPDFSADDWDNLALSIRRAIWGKLETKAKMLGGELLVQYGSTRGDVTKRRLLVQHFVACGGDVNSAVKAYITHTATRTEFTRLSAGQIEMTMKEMSNKFPERVVSKLVAIKSSRKEFRDHPDLPGDEDARLYSIHTGVARQWCRETASTASAEVTTYVDPGQIEPESFDHMFQDLTRRTSTAVLKSFGSRPLFRMADHDKIGRTSTKTVSQCSE